MNCYKTPIPGVAELSGVGYGTNQDSYDKAMSSTALKGCNVVVASLTTDQEDGVKFLLKNGFIQIGKAKRNPNTGHMILLLTKFLR